MTEPSDVKPTAPAGPPPAGVAEGEAFVRTLGRALMDSTLYGLHHGVTIAAMERCFAALSAALTASPRIDIGVGKDSMVVNGQPLNVKNPLVSACAQRIAARRITGFAVKQGMNADELVKLISFLSELRRGDEPEREGDRTLTELGLAHVATTRVVVTQVTGDEEIVVKRDGAPPPEETAPSSEEILAFLQGEAPPSDLNMLKAIVEASSDPGQLAQMIMDATAKRMTQAGAAGAVPLADAIVGCLRRTFSGLRADPSARTQKGKARLRKALGLLEQRLLQELKTSSVEGHGQAEQAVADAISEMQEELQIDELVGQYRKKTESAEESESRILRFMKKRGLEELSEIGLRDRLVAEGLPPDSWDRLVARSGLSRSGADSGVLTGLLAQLTQQVDGAADEQVVVTLRKVQSEVNAVAARTEQKIRELAATKTEKADGAPGARKDYRGLLSEIVQELCQPLAVVNCTIDMLSISRVGELNRLQKQAIDLAAESAKRLRVLIDKLLEVSGVPLALQPDRQKIGEIYGRPPSSPAPGAPSA